MWFDTWLWYLIFIKSNILILILTVYIFTCVIYIINTSFTTPQWWLSFLFVFSFTYLILIILLTCLPLFRQEKASPLPSVNFTEVTCLKQMSVLSPKAQQNRQKTVNDCTMSQYFIEGTLYEIRYVSKSDLEFRRTHETDDKQISLNGFRSNIYQDLKFWFFG